MSIGPNFSRQDIYFEEYFGFLSETIQGWFVINNINPIQWSLLMKVLPRNFWFRCKFNKATDISFVDYGRFRCHHDLRKYCLWNNMR